MRPIDEPARVTALLGPTNTGKTYAAVQRMLGHESGMIGFPLRLLARENYDRIAAIKGANAVALVTGEEKVIPPRARYFVCTTESMPLDRSVAFLAVDEVQMAADPERGHIVTNRLLHARGRHETMFLGAETIRPLLRQLAPEAAVEDRPRFSRLDYSGYRKVTRLPPRSAVVAFSASEVYRLAELVRRQRGGTAVVLGALSPRARNAQVGMYQAGEVDYLVATDAIGMGLNMDVRHVAFSALSKFDGRRMRKLDAAEIGQIAGRAGRHVADGTFGVTAEQRPMDERAVARVEEHRFEPLQTVCWRNADLDFSNVDSLLASLGRPPPFPFCVPGRDGEDHQALTVLAKDATVRAAAGNPERVAMLWEVCQIPDFRKTLTDAHAHLLGRVYRYLVDCDGRLPADWVARQVGRLERTDGDIDTLMARIAGVRTWTYIAYRAAWLDDAAGWQERTRRLEDLLSDALHERLTQRFVDRRTAVLARRLREGGDLMGDVARDGSVFLEGETVGRLDGFRYTAARGERGGRPLVVATQRVLRQEAARRVDALESARDGSFALDGDGRVLWNDEPVARLAAGSTALAPGLRILPSDLLETAPRRRVEARLRDWVEGLIARDLAPLTALARAEGLSGRARGIAYRLAEALGTLRRDAVTDLARSLSRADRQALGRMGVRIGRIALFVPGMQKSRASGLLDLLWRIHRESGGEPLATNRQILPLDPAVPRERYAAAGYLVAGPLALRAAVLERLADAAAGLADQGPFVPTLQLARLAGCRLDDLPAVLTDIGYEARDSGTGMQMTRSRPRPSRRIRPRPGSPFAKLAELKVGS
ncbi:MAG: disulfide oxidoreductase [Alphaproteobacteria bacterium]|nr:disulfide oxidoreductase [Alphaproteobacteria bacterium]